MAARILRSRFRQDAVAALVLLALTLTAFHRLALTDWILARGDTYSYHYPYWHARNEALLAGQLPLWTPDLFMGAPLLANPQLGTFYPPNWLVAPLSPPDGVRWSVIGHVFWTALGTYALARRSLGVGMVGGLIGATIFAFGGHIGAHVEQINQLQGLSWLPWLLFLFDRAIYPSLLRFNDANQDVGTPYMASVTPKNEINDGRDIAIPSAILLAMALALQVFSGHTQTVFISGAALGVYALCTRPIRGILTLISAAIGAGLLAIPQLIPTLELSSLSNRRGGFNVNQATAFSFNPFVTGRGLLPSFDRMIFSEYIAYPGIIGLALAWIGAFATRFKETADGIYAGRFSRVRRWFAAPQTRWSVLALLGLFLAYGLYNPLYLALAGLPGFNLFRVPARWLVLFALGVAMLAALGTEALVKNLTQRREDAKAQSKPFLRRHGITLLFPLLILALMIAAPLAEQTPDLTPTYPPETVTWVAWVIALIVATVGVVSVAWRTDNAGVVPTKVRRGLGTVVVVGSVAELLLASGALAYNQLVPPDAFSAQRFTISQMQIYSFFDNEVVPGRILSLSDLLFDPGDRAAQERRYDVLGITGEARALAFDTVKLREVLAANQPLLWGIPSIDGFDGGLLPTGYYTAFTSLMLPEGELRTLDGRLREILYNDTCGGACIPDQRWLAMTDTRYLLTDKVYDLVRDGVFFDTTFPMNGSAEYPNPNGFTATSVDLLYVCAAEPCDPPTIVLNGTDAQIAVPTVVDKLDRYLFARYPINSVVSPETVRVEAESGVIRAVTLVDEAGGTFQQLMPQPFKRLLSSDIKLYENGDVLPRVFTVHDAICVAEDEYGTEDALRMMRDSSFDPAETVILSGPFCEQTERREDITDGMGMLTHSYSPERIEVSLNNDRASYILLTDAFYPGWTATVDGEPTPVYRANVMFRAVSVTEGAHTVVFEYKPAWMPGIFIAGGALWVIAIAGAAISVGIKNRRAL